MECESIEMRNPFNNPGKKCLVMLKSNLKKILKKELVMNDLGVEKKLSRIEIRSDRRARWLYISHYIEKVLQSFYRDQSKRVGTSLAVRGGIGQVDLATLEGNLYVCLVYSTCMAP